ncbi:hypothetical protein [Actinoplanes subglobosus]|uniref:Uncharacterized protein n=1 Tax=Actinoplanes subglobosus TaxID=1547892 RepID=A0ABV8J3P4_9ACTN
MRHLRSIFYALVLAPCIWVLLAVGFTDDLSSRGRDFFTAESVSGLLLLIFAGILFSILAAGPVSPAGPVLAGAVYLGVTIWAFNAPGAYASLWAPEVAKEGFDLSRPGYGLAAVLAVPLLGTALSARRWARYEPPVLPIIGEIGRFRGAAKVAGTPVAAEQTTVIRTGVPADPTVAINRPGAADRTVAINSGRPADRTEIVANNDRTVFVTQPQSPAAPQPATPRPVTPQPAAPQAVRPVTPQPAAPQAVPAARVPESEPTTVLPIGSSEPTVVRGSGLAAGDEPTVVSGLGLAQAKPVPAAAARASATPGKPTTVSAAASAPVAASPAKPTTVTASTAGTSSAAKPAEEPTALVTAPAEEATTLIAAPTEEKTVLVTPPSDETEPLKLPTEPTAVIPAQRRPPHIES